MTASGAKIAAAAAWVIQNAAIAGVAAFAMVVSSSTTVGKYAAYFCMVESPCNIVSLDNDEDGASRISHTLMPNSYGAAGERLVSVSRRDRAPACARPTCTQPYSRISWSYSISDPRIISAISYGVPNSGQTKSQAN